jgi:phosphomannomutase/phosphoglucomutase
VHNNVVLKKYSCNFSTGIVQALKQICRQHHKRTAMKDVIFRQYDIRGIIGTELSLENVYDLTRAIAAYFKQQNPNLQTIAVGADGRTSSPAIKESVCQALQDSGLNVQFVGVCPTPVLYFALFNDPVDAGLMITASHNGPAYNGIKICLGKESVWGQQIQQIKQLFNERAHISVDKKGMYAEVPGVSNYVNWLKDHFKQLIGIPLSAVVDCGNGAAGTVLPELVRVMEWSNVALLYPEVDGTYPNHEADPTVEENMLAVREVLASTDVELGIGLDGDCDRMAPMTKSGELVSGDKLLALFAQEIVKQHPGTPIVFDVKCSAGLIELLEQWGAVPVMSASGHSIIKNQMKQQHALLAGELSCHFFFADNYFGYDDGIYAMMRLFDLLIKSGKMLDELLRVFPRKFSTSEMRIVCEPAVQRTIIAAVKETFKQQPDVHMIDIDGVRVMFKNGWGIVRGSNTQPVICLRFEADSPEHLDSVKQTFFTILSSYIDKIQLKKEMML